MSRWWNRGSPSRPNVYIGKFHRPTRGCEAKFIHSQCTLGQLSTRYRTIMDSMYTVCVCVGGGKYGRSVAIILCVRCKKSRRNLCYDNNFSLKYQPRKIWNPPIAQTEVLSTFNLVQHQRGLSIFFTFLEQFFYKFFVTPFWNTRSDVKRIKLSYCANSYVNMLILSY